MVDSFRSRLQCHMIIQKSFIMPIIMNFYMCSIILIIIHVDIFFCSFKIVCGNYVDTFIRILLGFSGEQNVQIKSTYFKQKSTVTL